jgi:hypothetical protein
MVENRGIYAVLVGSGVSRAAQIPTGWEITLDLLRRVAALHEEPDIGDPETWYLDKFGKNPDYSDLLDQLSRTRDERRSILHHYIEPTAEEREQGAKLPTEAHRAIACLVRGGYLRVVITTNFDRLLEMALKDEGIEPIVVASEDGIAGMVPLVHSRCTIIKVHGDYLDTRILNTDAELSRYPDAIRSLLNRVFDEFGLIVCGWSAEWDDALRDAILAAPSRRYPTWWATRSALKGQAADLARARDAREIPIELADGFFGALASKVEAAAESRRPHPFSGDLAVVELKRLLARPDHQIAVHDLVSKEVGRLCRVLTSDEFPVEPKLVDTSPEGFAARVERYDAETAVLRRMLSVLGRWAAKESVDLAVETINSLLKATKKRGGLDWWIELHRYSAAISWNTFATAAFRAGDLGAIAAVMSAEHRPEHEQAGPLGSWVQGWARFANFGKRDLWRTYPALERRHTGCLDHMIGVIRAAAADITQDAASLERDFDRFQVIGGLIELQRWPEEPGEVACIGRWWNEHYQDFLQEILRERDSHGCFGSGLFGEDPREFGHLLDRFLECHKGLPDFRWRRT